MGTKHPMSFGLSCLIKLHSSQHPFVLSCATTNHPLVPLFIQTINRLLIPPPNLTNHTPLTNCPYQPLAHKQDLSPLPLFWSPQQPITKPPNLPSLLQHICNLHLKSLVPLVGTNLLIEGQFVINILARHPIHPIKTL